MSISAHLDQPLAAVEVHPGDARNKPNDLAEAMVSLRDALDHQFGTRPLIMMENRSGQFIATGREIRGFWNYLEEQGEATNGCGIILDLQVLYTVTRASFVSELEKIPLESIRGIHVHFRHRAQTIADPVPWQEAFARLSGINGKLLVNPEVHHRKDVKPTVEFCERLIGRTRFEAPETSLHH